jgi:hypothetical protein
MPSYNTSLMSKRSAMRVAVGDGVLVAVDVLVGVGVLVGVEVLVRVGVLVDVLLGVGVFVGVIVAVGVNVSVGGALHGLSADDLLRGFGAPVAKSAALWSASVQPFAPRKIAVALLGAGALAVSLQFAVVP